ncbi:EVE domain-containing protein [Sabulicella rubraurantiaca]|uniref:EVE domain-containing protein n=1 Tax=Sabulicella rubraurantiaca TaxID=2811429 RepID=UPI001A974211|nr:EVE domain-containing protein [Sabulicella rubraurantiaca]
MRFFLLKSEPDAFSWEEQVARGVEPWTGVRNAQAAAVLRSMELGDRAFFYHSNIGKQVVGIVEVVRTAYPDPTASKGNWVCVDVRTVCPLPRPVTLAAIRAEKRLEGIPLVRQSRLSCMALDPAHWQVICELGGLVPAEAAA